jgi:hypothetical protein
MFLDETAPSGLVKRRALPGETFAGFQYNAARHRTDELGFQDRPQTRKPRIRKSAAAPLQIGVDAGRAGRVLQIMINLVTIGDKARFQARILRSCTELSTGPPSMTRIRLKLQTIFNI